MAIDRPDGEAHGPVGITGVAVHDEHQGAEHSRAKRERSPTICGGCIAEHPHANIEIGLLCSRIVIVDQGKGLIGSPTLAGVFDELNRSVGGD